MPWPDCWPAVSRCIQHETSSLIYAVVPLTRPKHFHMVTRGEPRVSTLPTLQTPFCDVPGMRRDSGHALGTLILPFRVMRRHKSAGWTCLVANHLSVMLSGVVVATALGPKIDLGSNLHARWPSRPRANIGYYY